MLQGGRAVVLLAIALAMDTSAMFEVPASATGLRVAFRSLATPASQAVVVALD